MRWAPWFAAVVAGWGCARGTGESALVDVRRDDLVVRVEVTGELAALDATDVMPPSLTVGSTLKVSWMAAEGSEVKPGEPLVTLDTSDLDRALEAEQAVVDESQQRLDRKRQQATLARHNDDLKLLEAEAAARKSGLKIEASAELVAALDRREQQFDDELATLSLAQARRVAEVARHADDAELQDLTGTRDSARRQIAEIKRNRGLLAIAAPRGGTVVYATDYRGEKRKIGDSIFRSDPILQVVGLGAMVGNGKVDEVDLARLAPRQPVMLRVDALPDLQLHGTLTSIATSVVAPADGGSDKTVHVVIAVAPTTGAALRPGMRFRGQIETLRVPGVIQLAAEAVFVTADGPMAYRETGGGLERVALRLGRRSADAIEIESGLAPGDRVSRVDPTQEAP